MSQQGIEPGSQELASCTIIARLPQHDTTGPHHRAFNVFQGYTFCYLISLSLSLSLSLSVSRFLLLSYSDPSLALLVPLMKAGAASLVDLVQKMALSYAWSVYAGRPLKEKESSPSNNSGKRKSS